MVDNKAWWQSRTILASGVAMLAVLARAAGHEIGPEEEGALIDAISSLIALGASLTAIWGRLRAQSTLRPKNRRA